MNARLNIKKISPRRSAVSAADLALGNVQRGGRVRSQAVAVNWIAAQHGPLLKQRREEILAKVEKRGGRNIVQNHWIYDINARIHPRRNKAIRHGALRKFCDAHLLVAPLDGRKGDRTINS